jgi:protein-disulfide isomerase
MSTSTQLVPGLTPAIGLQDHVRGSESARVTLLEYGDFQCPQCANAYPIVAELSQSLGAALRFVFRNFPLTNVHPQAQRAAEAAEWAASLGAFWPMYDALYQQRSNLSERRILELAESLGLDPASLAHAWADHTFFARVKQDFMSGLASGVTGTPTFFINGARYEGDWASGSLTQALAVAP